MIVYWVTHSHQFSNLSSTFPGGPGSAHCHLHPGEWLVQNFYTADQMPFLMPIKEITVSHSFFGHLLLTEETLPSLPVVPVRHRLSPKQLCWHESFTTTTTKPHIALYSIGVYCFRGSSTRGRCKQSTTTIWHYMELQTSNMPGPQLPSNAHMNHCPLASTRF